MGTGQYLGWDIANVGDLDGDGLDELAVGAYGSSKTVIYAGSAMQQGGSLPSGRRRGKKGLRTGER